VQSLLVKPIGTQDLLRQIEVLLIRQQDEKQSRDKTRLIPADEVPLQEQKAS
jgi:DNA-binding response OmpR family regulator